MVLCGIGKLSSELCHVSLDGTLGVGRAMDDAVSSLTASAIQNHACGMVQQAPLLLGYWKFDENFGAICLNSASMYASDGMLVGGIKRVAAASSDKTRCQCMLTRGGQREFISADASQRRISGYKLQRRTSASTPVAVTSPPAPAPWTTTGRSPYRSVLNATMLSGPALLNLRAAKWDGGEGQLGFHFAQHQSMHRVRSHKLHMKHTTKHCPHGCAASTARGPTVAAPAATSTFAA
jgi:hypothetical protein